MIAHKILIGTALAASQVSAAILPRGLAVLLNVRAEDLSPGSPAYNCHDNCGEAILQTRYDTTELCTDNVFLTDYANCLQCAGPDNADIWKYYGSSLESFAKACDLSTTPASGTQADVGEALPAATGGNTATSAAATATSTADTATETATTDVAETASAPTAASTAAPSAASPTSSGNAAPGVSTASGGASATGTVPSTTASASGAVVTAGASIRSVTIGLGAAAMAVVYAIVY